MDNEIQNPISVMSGNIYDLPWQHTKHMYDNGFFMAKIIYHI